MICADLPDYTGAMSRYPYSGEREKLYARTSRFGEKYNTSIQEGKWLWVPRGTCPIGKFDARTSRSMGVAINCKCPPLDEDQADVIAKCTALLKAGTDHVFEAPTGFGKTYCGAAIAVNLNQAALIIVPKSDLIGEWYDTLTHLIGVEPKEIGLIRQNKCNFAGKRFVIGMLHSLVGHPYPKEMYEYFGMVLFDETHRLGAETFSQAARIFPAMYRLGISATPERSDGKETIFKQHIGPTLVEGKTIPMRPKILVKYTNWEIPMTVVKDEEHGGWKREKIIPAGDRMMGVFGQMGKDKKRNQLIVDFVVQAYRKNRIILLTGHLIEGHLVPMFHLLGQAGIPAEVMGYYISGLTIPEYRRVKTKCKVVLATYKMVEEGTNVPWWDCLCMLTPIARPKQTIGRIMRRYPGKPIPVALDLVDKDGVFHGYFSSRQKQYKSDKVDGTVIWVK